MTSHRTLRCYLLLGEQGEDVEERVQKLMAQANVGSRRACEELIREGRVRVNDHVIQLGAKADPEKDKISVDGEPLWFQKHRKVYYALNKPINVLTTNVANHRDDRPTVRDMLPVEGHLFSIGRLDADSDGLVVLTNDGDLVQKLTHPRYGHTKTYKVVVYGLPNAETIAQWESGVFLEEGKTAPCLVRILKGSKDESVLRVVMTEGKKRQIRRVATQLGHPVKRLTRTHIGQLALGELRLGEWRELKPHEVQLMLKPAEELEQKRRERPRTAPQRQKSEGASSSVQRNGRSQSEKRSPTTNKTSSRKKRR